MTLICPYWDASRRSRLECTRSLRHIGTYLETWIFATLCNILSPVVGWWMAWQPLLDPIQMATHSRGSQPPSLFKFSPPVTT